MAKIKKKLVFDISGNSGTTPAGVGPALNGGAAVVCTQETTGTLGDRYDSLLQQFSPLTIGAPAQARQLRQVMAVFVPKHIAAGINPTIKIRFVDETGTAVPGSNVANAVSQTGPILTATDPTFTKRIRIFINALATAAASIRGTLYVQRQHSIEV